MFMHSHVNESGTHSHWGEAGSNRADYFYHDSLFLRWPRFPGDHTNHKQLNTLSISTEALSFHNIISFLWPSISTEQLHLSDADKGIMFIGHWKCQHIMELWLIKSFLFSTPLARGDCVQPEKNGMSSWLLFVYDFFSSTRNHWFLARTVQNLRFSLRSMLAYHWVRSFIVYSLGPYVYHDSRWTTWKNIYLYFSEKKEFSRVNKAEKIKLEQRVYSSNARFELTQIETACAHLWMVVANWDTHRTL